MIRLVNTIELDISIDISSVSVLLAGGSVAAASVILFAPLRVHIRCYTKVYSKDRNNLQLLVKLDRRGYRD